MWNRSWILSQMPGTTRGDLKKYPIGSRWKPLNEMLMCLFHVDLTSKRSFLTLLRDSVSQLRGFDRLLPDSLLTYRHCWSI